MPNRKLNVGDVFEVQTPNGLAYLQYTHPSEGHGELVRVLPGLFATRPDVTNLCKDRELYFTFYVLSFASRKKLVTFVSNEAIPKWAQQPPLMRFDRGFDRITKPAWLIENAFFELTLENLIQAKDRIKHELTPEEEKLSINSLWGHTGMIERLAEEWTPARDRELFLKHPAEAERKGSAQHQDIDTASATKYYLYFPKKGNADDSAGKLREKGWQVSIERVADEKSWLVLATPPALYEPDVFQIDEELHRLAEDHHGEYDGSETKV